jgi:putative polyhydroxyalkanoate system protein
MAKHIEVSQSHSLSPEDARQRMTTLLGRLEEKYGLSTSWVGDTEARVEGKGVAGCASLAAGSVSVTADLSLPASMLAGRIEKALREALEKEFS